MKILLTVLAISILTLTASSQKTNPNYDAELAAKLGADEYGMKQFVLVMLKTGGNLSTDKALRDSCFAGHMNNISRLVEEKKLIVAGPLVKNDNAYRGIFILDVKSLEEAADLMQTDPAISADFLKPEFYQWYGSAALSEYLEASDKVWKTGF
ncbi:MAG: YciI family protein [Cyclobacteriaceae bacterium]